MHSIITTAYFWWMPPWGMRQATKCGSNWGCCHYLYKSRLYNVLSNVTYWPSHSQAGSPMINIQPALRTAPDWCSNVLLQCYLVATAVHIQSVRSRCVCVCTHIHTYIHTYMFFTMLGKRNKREKLGQQWMPLAIGSSALVWPTICGPKWCSRYRDSLRTRRSGDRIPVEARFSALVQTGPGSHPVACTMGTGYLSLE